MNNQKANLTNYKKLLYHNMKSFLTSTLFIIIASTSWAIEYDPNHLPNTYRSKDNPYYWKNKKPTPVYWQQDVYYKIKATINDSLDVIDAGSYELTYWNNSPDTLYYTFFHLYQNAFQPGSYLSSNYLNNDKKVRYGAYEGKGLGTIIDYLAIDGKETKDTVLDNTILRVNLPKPLLPGKKVVFTMRFKSYFDRGTLRRRMKLFEHDGVKHYDGVHWYPSMAVYDAKFGWTTEQHLDKEFYSDFGTFDIQLTMPNNYIVGATGTLQNENKALPEDLRQKLDLKNFQQRPDTISTPIIRDDAKPRMWHFYAENVHNFAFTADPTYRIREVEWNGVIVQTLAQEPNAWGWQQSGEFTKNVVKTYATDFGMYAWPKIIIADARDGMEYPMMTLDGGTYGIRQQYLLAHEVGHMWFYGMVGSNETYRAFLDEGFTQFLTVWSMDAILGATYDYKEAKGKGKRNYILEHLYHRDHRYERLYYPYIRTIHQGFDHQLNTHSAQFNGAVRHGGNYGLVYYKTGVMLYNLKYVLGDELFLKAMQYYFNKWKMCHPYGQDFRQSIIEYTKIDLNWFFDQWLETKKHIDYGIKKVKKVSSNEYNITFERIGRMHMPLDFTVISQQGDTLHYTIPNTWFHKKGDFTVLPKWYGWDNINPMYTATITVENGIENILIDPSNLLADIDKRNNVWKHTQLFELDHQVRNRANWDKAENFIRPDVWYNHFDGLQIGLQVRGNYFKQTNIYNASIWYNTRLIQRGSVEPAIENENQPISYHLYAKQSLRKIWSYLSLEEYSRFNAGLFKTGFTLQKTFQAQDARNPEYTVIKGNFDWMYRDVDHAEYLIYPAFWLTNRIHATINLSVERHYRYSKGNGLVKGLVRTPGVGSDVAYNFLQLEAINNNWVGKVNFKTRFFSRIGFGDTPAESLVSLTGNQEAISGNKFTRAAGFFAQGTDNFIQGGGLGLRQVNFSINGNTAVSGNVEIEFQKLIPWKPALTKRWLRIYPYTFGNVGTFVNRDFNDFSQVYADAGVGIAAKISFNGYDIKPFTIRLDVPLVDNLSNDVNYLIGIGRSF